MAISLENQRNIELKAIRPLPSDAPAMLPDCG
jgi:hypothetical protein